MSQVALSGNASGTGTFIIASPNSNTNRTLDLPDNSGTVVSTGSTAVVTQAMLATAVIPLGVGQTWQDVTSSRAAGTTYTNTTGRPIAVALKLQSAAGAWEPYMTIGGVNVQNGGAATNNASYGTGYYIVPSGATYVLVANGGSLSSNGWCELR